MKGRTAVQIGVLAVISASILFTASCTKRSLIREESERRGKPGEEIIVQRSDKQAPKWVFDPEFQVEKEKREKLVVVIADIQHKDRRAAERIAEGELRKRVAEGIKTLVNSQFGEALSGNESSFTQSFESYVATVADNVPVVGLIITDTYWEKIQKFKDRKQFDYFYRIVKRAQMPYENYIKARDKAWDDVLRNVQNEQERAELQRLILEMKRMDEV
jgi:hypothetical protein